MHTIHVFAVCACANLHPRGLWKGLCVKMKKRKRKEVEEGEINQESESRGSSKKAKIGVDPLKKFLSLVEAGDSAAGDARRRKEQFKLV